MEGKTIYFLFTDTGTFLAKLINYVTKQPLNHVSISFDPELKEVYSFGRKKPRNPFIGGFVKEDVRSDFLRHAACEVYTMQITETECRSIKDRIAEIELRKQNYKYNFLGLIAILLQVELNRKDALFCSQFVATVLQHVKALKFDKPLCFVTPEDIRRQKALTLIYEGTLEEYQQKFEIPEHPPTSEEQPQKSSFFFSFKKRVKQLVTR